MSLRFCFSVMGTILVFMGVVAFFERTMLSVYGRSDFFVFYETIRFYFSGQDLYSHYIINNGVGYIREAGNLNAPFLTLLLLPLGQLNYAHAFDVWVLILTACLLGGAYLALRPFPQWHKKAPLILLMFLLFFPNLQTVIYGQISPVLFLFVVLGWLLARENIKNKDNWAGIFIGLACSLKLFCGLFLIYFLCLKRYRLFAVSLAVFLGISVLAWWMFGTQAYISYYESLKGIFWYAGTWDISFHGFFMRLFSNVEHNIPLIVAPQLSTLFTYVFSALLMGFLLWRWTRDRKEKGAETKEKKTEEKKYFDRGFSLVIVSMLLISPLSWIYYFCLLFIPYLVLVSEGNDWVHLIACFLLLLSMKIPLLVLASGIKTPLQIFWTGGVGFYVLLGMLGLLFKTYPESRQFTPRLWYVIYTLIFFVPVLVLVLNFFSLTFGR